MRKKENHLYLQINDYIVENPKESIIIHEFRKEGPCDECRVW